MPSVWLTEILETFPHAFWFEKSRIKEIGGKERDLRLVDDQQRDGFVFSKHSFGLISGKMSHATWFSLQYNIGGVLCTIFEAAREVRKHARHKYSFPVHLSCSFLLRSVAVSSYRIHPSAKVSDFLQFLFSTPCDLRDLRVVVDFDPSHVLYVTRNEKKEKI